MFGVGESMDGDEEVPSVGVVPDLILGVFLKEHDIRGEGGQRHARSVMLLRLFEKEVQQLGLLLELPAGVQQLASSIVHPHDLEIQLLEELKGNDEATKEAQRHR